MNFFITRINAAPVQSTAEYAQRMVSDIAHPLGFKDLGIYFYNSSKESMDSLSSRYDGIIAGIRRGDVIVFQYPTWNHGRFEKGLIRRMKLYGGRIIIFIHDIEAFMFEKSRFLIKETMEIFNMAEVLIVPSYAMTRLLIEHGVRENMKFVIQEIWDYITDINFMKSPKLKKEIHFAGSPEKLPAPNQWNYDIPLKLYSSELCSGENVQKLGWINPSALLLELAKGGFGLLWYGNEYWHQYMRYNNTFKLSTYLSAGIPIIAPKGISNQHLLEKNHLGLIVDSVDEAVEKVKKMTEEDYKKYVEYVNRFAVLIRGGFFTKKLLIEAIHAIQRNDMFLNGFVLPEGEYYG